VQLQGVQDHGLPRHTATPWQPAGRAPYLQGYIPQAVCWWVVGGDEGVGTQAAAGGGIKALAAAADSPGHQVLAFRGDLLQELVERCACQESGGQCGQCSYQPASSPKAVI
jgi:hypothetical protein